jgi:hypothetical protein
MNSDFIQYADFSDDDWIRMAFDSQDCDRFHRSMEHPIQVTKGLVFLMSATYYSSTRRDHLAGNDQENLGSKRSFTT